jgi:hypothetical protein
MGNAFATSRTLAGGAVAVAGRSPQAGKGWGRVRWDVAVAGIGLPSFPVVPISLRRRRPFNRHTGLLFLNILLEHYAGRKAGGSRTGRKRLTGPA